MKRLLVLFGLTLSCSTFCMAWNPPDGLVGMSSDSKQISISTTPSSPTHILNKESFSQGTWIVNPTTYTLFVSSVSSNLSFSSSFCLYPGSTSSASAPIYWSPDGVNSPYQGDLYMAASTGTTQPKISVWKSK